MITKPLVSTLVLAACITLSAQDPQAIAPEELAKATQLLMDANARLGDLPLKLELVPDQATGFKVEDVGAILIPDRRLKPEKRDRTARRSGGSEMIVGQLWTSKLSPKAKDAVLANDRLRLVKVSASDKELELAVFTLRIERAGKKELQLALYARDNAPVLRVPLTPEKAKGAAPVVMTARRTGEEEGVLELKLLGRFKAQIPVGKQAG